MAEALCVEQGRKSRVVDAALCSLDQHPRTIFIARKTGSVFEMDETHVMRTAIVLGLLSTNMSTSFFLKKSFDTRVK